LPVVTQNRLSGRITLLASHKMPEARRQTACVKEIMSAQCNVAYPDEDLFIILKRFAASDVGNLPVVTREKPDCPVGLVTRSALWQAIESAKEQQAGRRTEAKER
jgi:CIC family chloride channel protein